MSALKKSTKIFGTDGVRGRANFAPMTVEIALALGRAAGKIFQRHEGNAGPKPIRCRSSHVKLQRLPACVSREENRILLIENIHNVE